MSGKLQLRIMVDLVIKRLRLHVSLVDPLEQFLRINLSHPDPTLSSRA